MRLAKSSVTVIALLALLAWAAPNLRAQTQSAAKAPPAAKKPGKTEQPSKAAPPAKHPAKAAEAQKPAAKAPEKKQPAKAAAPKQPPRKEAKAKKPEKPAGPEAVVQARAARRDPFDPLVSKSKPGGGMPERLPPGKAGLIISTLRLDGLVRGPSGMIAVVSNPQQRVYFLREGDQLYDGKVERITMELVAFHEVGKDAFGKPVERQVVKRLYPSSGEMR